VPGSSKDLSHAGKKTWSTRSSDATHRNHREKAFRPSGAHPVCRSAQIIGITKCSSPSYIPPLGTLTRVSLADHKFSSPSGGLSDVLEGDTSLEIACLDVGFENPTLRRSGY
jgi:hypothetical protein